MSFFNTKELLSELKQIVVSHINYAESLKNTTTEDLQYKKTAKSWSVLECLEHLNLYAEFYNNEIRKRIEKSKYQKSTVFKSGYLGNKFALDMLPKEGMKTMNTFKSKNPIYSKLDEKVVLERFIMLQKELLQLLELSEDKNLTKVKTSTTLPILKFRLGDTFRFVINHNQRHIIQAKNICK
ncbi:DinB family protein [Tenacibaculum finnmarkense]|uniref:DinB family protein n=1 Tax=Tenacibaculum finnmarkense TaxID=2781243 RepID=UPI001E28FB3D|nr:DinB family protein [Tenacibaculum finnmarkense]MCD8401920.1 DinB family protein [Tenacibaculum finnmarkense genomovar finnmarkense]MCD8446013.1 DinB family protein [Tenacibaculum finnmarkense genomovar finnmarkense]MCG8893340.1 DinB family protein [Tenacibaculum finnmarkense]MCG8900729.1 DinB family protein [Tenacibaculum finnmarkense]WCC46665.1 DinB family protein [Tenacibaculum finnmarkense]